MNKRKKQNLMISSMIGILCLCMFILFGLMMPKKPEPQIKAIDPVVETNVKGVVVVDAGHGGYDDGSVSSKGDLEKEITLEIALKVKNLLEKEGVEVIMTRDSDVVSWSNDNTEDLQARLTIASNANADMMVSLHCNSYEEDPDNVRGSEVYANSKQEDSQALAQAIHLELSKLDIPARGVKTGALHLLTYNTLPTVIVEMGYITNDEDLQALLDEASQNEISERIVAGILTGLHHLVWSKKK